MKKLICLACVVAMVALTTLAASSVRAADETVPTIKAIMKLHKGAKSSLAQLKTLLGAGSPDWAEVKKLTKQFDTLGASLPKNEAPKGDQANFEKLAKAYASTAHDLDAAADKEDVVAAKKAVGKIGSSCMACHKAHKP